MKNLITLLMFFIIIENINSQAINFPDPNFKAKLLSANTINGIARAVNFVSIIINTNGNNDIEVSEALLVKELYIGNANISSLVGIENFTNLTGLYCSYNSISTADISQLPSLLGFDCTNNNLNSLNIGNLNQLFGLSLESNNLTTLNLSGLPNLKNINANYNQLTSIDLSNNYFFEWGEFTDNNLQYAILKNGNLENFAIDNNNYRNNPNLQYLCVNDNYVTPISTIINATVGIPSNVVVTSYCTFTPGGIYYTIQGNTKYDLNNNGCDAGDNNFANLKINFNDGTSSGTVIANSSGAYALPVSAGTYTITPVLDNPNYFLILPTSTTVTFPTTASPFTQNFCISPNGVHNDLSVDLIPTGYWVPGYDSQYKIKFKNKGTQTQSGNVHFIYQDAILDVVSTFPVATTSIPNTLTWSFSNLQPFETREVIVNLNLNSPLEIPAVNSGDILNFSSEIIGLTDETPTDNVVDVNQTVVNAYDPNDKTCLQGNTISPNKIGDYIHYMIRFENTGTANAQNVVIKDIIDSVKFDISTLQFLDSSHSCITKISDGNKIEFIFKEINLPFNNAINKGYVVFKIKSKPTLIVGDQITNNANIYFDYNVPIVTNTAISTFQALKNIDFEYENSITISPIPAHNYLNIINDQKVNITSILIYNIDGKLVQTIINPLSNLDVSNLKSGNYIIKIIADNGIKNIKFTKK